MQHEHESVSDAILCGIVLGLAIAGNKEALDAVSGSIMAPRMRAAFGELKRRSPGQSCRAIAELCGAKTDGGLASGFIGAMVRREKRRSEWREQLLARIG